MKLSIHEVLTSVVDAKTKADKVSALARNDSPVLRGVLQVNFDPSVTLTLPEGEPPFKKDTGIPIGISDTSLLMEWRRMYIWIKDHPNNPNIPKNKAESLFVGLLEGIHWTDAELLCSMKDKQLAKRYKGLTDAIVREAFPDLLPPPKSKPTKEAGAA